MKRQDRVRFFQEHAGYATPPGRMNCAAAMADAEYAFEQSSFEFRWTLDEFPDLSYLEQIDENGRYLYSKTEREADHEVWCCALVDDDGATVTALCGIIDPDANYRRVIEAELACEAIDALRCYSI